MIQCAPRNLPMGSEASFDAIASEFRAELEAAYAYLGAAVAISRAGSGDPHEMNRTLDFFEHHYRRACAVAEQGGHLALCEGSA